MQCGNCGSEISENARFCETCGASIVGYSTERRYMVMTSYEHVPGHGKAIASLVLGIASIVFGGLALGIVGIVMGVNGKKELLEAGYPAGIATAGLVCSIIGTAIGSIVFVACYVPLALGGLGLGSAACAGCGSAITEYPL